MKIEEEIGKRQNEIREEGKKIRQDVNEHNGMVYKKLEQIETGQVVANSKIELIETNLGINSEEIKELKIRIEGVQIGKSNSVSEKIVIEKRSERVKLLVDVENPMQFVKNLKEECERNDVTEWNDIYNIINHCLSQDKNFSCWWIFVKGEVNNLEGFVEKFKHKYWSDVVQNKVKCNLFNGRYSNKSESMADYFLKKFNQARFLEPNMGEPILVQLLSEHFEKEIRWMRVSHKITDAESFIQLLDEVDSFKVKNVTGENQGKFGTLKEGKYQIRTNLGYQSGQTQGQGQNYVQYGENRHEFGENQKMGGYIESNHNRGQNNYSNDNGSSRNYTSQGRINESQRVGRNAGQGQGYRNSYRGNNYNQQYNEGSNSNQRYNKGGNRFEPNNIIRQGKDSDKIETAVDISNQGN